MYVITPSQVCLLKTEFNLLSNSVPLERKRKNEITKLIDSSKVYVSYDYDHIDLGTLFSFKLTGSNGEVINFNDVEFINFAVSDEYHTEYIERISTLGQVIYGLSKGSKFKLRTGNVHYTGEITNINSKYLERYKNGFMYKK